MSCSCMKDTDNPTSGLCVGMDLLRGEMNEDNNVLTVYFDKNIKPGD